MPNIACERLIGAACALHSQGLSTFGRVDLRNWIMDKYPDVTKQRWNNTYNPSIQAMKTPTSPGAPRIGQKYRGIFQYLGYNTHALSEYGKALCE